ncbi:MAG TPA: RidA family protein [Jatrophihabitantaceae bacterium]|jgi:enamine deaminase RidA (YjgF/YER057c/UK114 family)
MMRLGPLDPPDGPKAQGGYAQGFSVPPGTGLLFISGQIPVDTEGATPYGFEAQCRQAWRNLVTVLRAADLGVEHLVKVSTYLSDRKYADINAEVRRQLLGGHRPALTVIVADIFEGGWLLEIEAIAAVTAAV